MSEPRPPGLDAAVRRDLSRLTDDDMIAVVHQMLDGEVANLTVEELVAQVRRRLAIRSTQLHRVERWRALARPRLAAALVVYLAAAALAIGNLVTGTGVVPGTSRAVDALITAVAGVTAVRAAIAGGRALADDPGWWLARAVLAVSRPMIWLTDRTAALFRRLMHAVTALITATAALPRRRRNPDSPGRHR